MAASLWWGLMWFLLANCECKILRIQAKNSSCHRQSIKRYPTSCKSCIQYSVLWFQIYSQKFCPRTWLVNYMYLIYKSMHKLCCLPETAGTVRELNPLSHIQSVSQWGYESRSSVLLYLTWPKHLDRSTVKAAIFDDGWSSKLY